MDLNELEQYKAEVVDYYLSYYESVIHLRDHYYDRLEESPANKKHYDAIVRDARKQLYHVQDAYKKAKSTLAKLEALRGS